MKKLTDFLNESVKKEPMTIKDYVLSKPTQGINEWLKDIESDRLTKHEKTILDCADHFNKIKINHSADFKKSINTIIK